MIRLFDRFIDWLCYSKAGIVIGWIWLTTMVVSLVTELSY